MPLVLFNFSAEARWAALAGGIGYTRSDLCSTALGMETGATEAEAKRNALEACAATVTRVRVTCKILDTWSNGCGFATTGKGNLPDGTPWCGWSSTATKESTINLMYEKLYADGVTDPKVNHNPISRCVTPEEE